jgi:hypothetical protein
MTDKIQCGCRPLPQTFTGQTGRYSHIQCISILYQRESMVLQWALKLNSTPAAAETWDYAKGFLSH